MLAREGEIIIVLPLDQAEFQRTSVDLIPGADWSQRFHQVLERASRVIIANDNRTTGDEITYAYANLLLDGLAILRARMLDTEVIPLVVWDGKAGDGPGGTASLVEHWQTHGLEPEVIDITKLLVEILPVPSPSAPGKTPEYPEGASISGHLEFTQEIRAMLFADITGSSRIRDEQVPIFVEYFLGAIKTVIAESAHRPSLTNTWGDALYGVFSSIQDAGIFALQLRDRISGTNWLEKGLPPDLNLRISLHAGPVYCFKKPLFQEAAYGGSHIVRAARIEPITPPGQVYASQQFAALASSQRLGDYICEYVGQIPLPKNSGIIPLYLVRRPNP
jgi:class 3 adenylate cyclase